MDGIKYIYAFYFLQHYMTIYLQFLDAKCGSPMFSIYLKKCVKHKYPQLTMNIWPIICNSLQMFKVIY